MLRTSFFKKSKSVTLESTISPLKSIDSAYEMHMERARINMLLSLKLLEKHEIRPKYPHILDKYKNLYLSHKSGSSPDSSAPCFDDIWDRIKNIFDNIQNGIGSEDDQRLALKSVIYLLISVGIPFSDGKTLTFWSSNLARDEAHRYARENNAVTDIMAVSYLKKILIGWQEPKLTVLGDLVLPPNTHIVAPPYPQLYKIFWLAMSEVYAESALPQADVHIFFQDSLLTGNFFWLAELPILRDKNCRLLIHRYDHHNHTWLPATHFDSKKSDNIPLRRIMVHPADGKVSETAFRVCGYDKIWKVKCNESENEGLRHELIEWSAPSFITIGKLKKIARRLAPKKHCRPNPHALYASAYDDKQIKKSESPSLKKEKNNFTP